MQDYAHKLISISIFHGNENDIKKNQLFRAEWDDYNIDTETRPQPHWHITRDNAIYDKFSDLTNHNDEKEKVGFEFFEEVQTEVFDTKKIHFAMSGNWQNKLPPVHKIDDATKVADWMEGLLQHIKYELKNWNKPYIIRYDGIGSYLTWAAYPNVSGNFITVRKRQ